MAKLSTSPTRTGTWARSTVRPASRSRPFSTSCWASARVFTIRANQRNLSSRRLSATPQLGERRESRGERLSVGGLAPASAAPDPFSVALPKPEADILHQAGDRLGLQPERDSQR